MAFNNVGAQGTAAEDFAGENRTPYYSTAISGVYRAVADFDAEINAFHNGGGNVRITSEPESRDTNTHIINLGSLSLVDGFEPTSQHSTSRSVVADSDQANNGSNEGETIDGSNMFREGYNTNHNPEGFWQTNQAPDAVTDTDEPQMAHGLTNLTNPPDSYAIQQWLEKPERHERLACQYPQLPISRTSKSPSAKRRTKKGIE